MSTTTYARRGVVAGAAALAILGIGGAGAAHADPAPHVPAGTRVTAAAIPDGFQMVTMSLGRTDDPAMGQYRPVAMTQLLLKRWSPSLAVDGSFGYGTQNAVKAFQRAEGLPVTGSLDRSSFYRLFVRQTVQYGATGDAVRAAQIWLTRNPAAGVTVDGSFGAVTRAAVLAEQRSHGECHGTGPDGSVGPMTRAMSYEWEHEPGSC